MAQLPGQGIDPQGDYDEVLLADGQYLFDVVDSEFLEGSKEGSTYIKIVADGVDGTPSQGVRIYQNFTYENKNAKAVAMGTRAFAKLSLACGVGEHVRDTAILHNRRFLGTVYTEEGNGGYEDKNQFKDYQSANAAATGAPPVPQAAWAPPGAPPAPPAYQAPPIPTTHNPHPQQPQQPPQYAQPAPDTAQYAQQPQYAPAPPQYVQPPAGYPPQPQYAPQAPAAAPPAQQYAQPPAPQAPPQAAPQGPPQGPPPPQPGAPAPPWAQ